MYSAMKENLDTLEYKEAVTTNITVSPTRNGSQVIYSADANALQALIEALIDIENAQ